MGERFLSIDITVALRRDRLSNCGLTMRYTRRHLCRVRCDTEGFAAGVAGELGRWAAEIYRIGRP